MARTSRPKRVNYELIDPLPFEMDDVLLRLIREHHQHLEEARIGLAWRKELKPDVDGRVSAGQTNICSDLDREKAPYDVVVVLNKTAWEDWSADAREAVLDHFLCRVQIRKDREGEPRRDERGRLCYRKRKPEVVEFVEIIERHGAYTADHQAYAAACASKRAMPLFAATTTNGEAEPVEERPAGKRPRPKARRRA